MKKKRVVALAMTAAMCVGLLAGCGNSGNDGGSTSDDGVVTLKWVTVGNGMPDNYEDWLAQVNPYLEEKIGVNVDMEVVGWGDWDNRRSVITNSGEYFDILFTDQTRFNSEVSNGVFLDITDMLPEAAPDLYELIPEDYWKAVSSDSKIYGVPTMKDNAITEYFVWDKDVADKYGIDINSITDFDSLYPALQKIKEGEGTAPFFMSKAGASVLIDMNYDDLSSGSKVIGVKYGDDGATVVNPLDDPDILANLETIHKMYTEGLINGDAPTADDTNKYHMLFIAQGWSGAAKTTWGPNFGIANCEAVQFGDSVMCNKTIQGSINGIYSGCKNPEKALELLQLINTDTKLRDMFYFGVEGEDWQYTDDNKVERLTSDWALAGYTQGNTYIVSQQTTEETSQWDEVIALNDEAVRSPLLGFSMDTSSVQTQLANCNAVYEKYYPELFTGAQEPNALIAQMKSELETAGWDDLCAAAQEQVDEFMGK